MEPGNAFLGPDGLDWARHQLREAGHDQSTVAHLVRKVHEVLQPYADVMTPEEVTEACHVLSRLVDGKSLDEREYWSKQRQEEQLWDWAPALPRTIGPGSAVRVRPDAYDRSDARYIHNGRVGVVAAIRRDVIVTYTDQARPEPGIGQHHELNKLERQVPFRPQRR
jgi:hypothetical protein